MKDLCDHVGDQHTFGVLIVLKSTNIRGTVTDNFVNDMYDNTKMVKIHNGNPSKFDVQ